MPRHRLFPLAIVTAVLVSAAACPPRKASRVAAPSPAPGARVVVLYTASVQGYVEPCGCTADPLGGVARLGAVVEEMRKVHGERVLVLDAGDLLFEKLDDDKPADLCQAEARIDVLLDAYAKNGLAATVVGPLDDVRGAAFRDARLHARGIATLGLGAARALTSPAALAPSLVKDVGGVKVGVVGVRVDDKSQLAPARAALEAETRKLVAAGAQATVALAQAPRDLARALADGIAGLDVVILGRAPGEVPTAPERLGASGPVLVASAHQAQHLGVVELVLEGRAPGAALALDDRQAALERRMKVLDVRIAELETQIKATEDVARRAFFEQRALTARSERAALSIDTEPAPSGPHIVARAIALTRGMREEPRAAEALAAYQAAVPALVARCEANAFCPELKTGQPAYVGAAACKACHAAAWTFWQEQRVMRSAKDKEGRPYERPVGHARAWQTLVEEKKDTDRMCVGCHSVAFGAVGGACKTSDIVPRGLDGVQCESCHGAGSAHVAAGDKRFIARAPTEAQCRACHQVPHIATTASFVFAESLKLVTGAGHGAPIGTPAMDGGPGG